MSANLGTARGEILIDIAKALASLDTLQGRLRAAANSGKGSFDGATSSADRLGEQAKTTGNEIEQGMAQGGRAATGLMDRLTSASGRMKEVGDKISGFGQQWSSAISAPIFAAAKAGIQNASDVAEAQSAVNTVYGDGAAQVSKWADSSATALGMSREQYLSQMSVLGVYGDMLGMNGQETAQFANELVQASADLGSFYNANSTEVLGAMQAALRGEFDPLERFGILLNQNELQQYAMAKGIVKGNEEMTQQQKIAATHAYILDHLGAASGDFGNTSDGLANQMRILKAELSDVSAELGAVLLPVVLKGVGILRKLIAVFRALPDSLKTFVVIAGLAVAAIGPLLVGFGMLISSLGTVMAAFSAGNAAAGVAAGPLAGIGAVLGPILLVVAALAALGVAYKLNLFGFRDAVNKVAGAIASPFKKIKSVFDGLMDAPKAALGGKGGFEDPFGNWVAAPTVVPQMSKIQTVMTNLGKAIEQVTGLPVAGFFKELGNSIQRPLDGIAKFWGGLKKLNSAFQDGGLKGGFKALFGGVGKQISAGIGDTLASVPKAIGKQMLKINTGFKPLDRAIHASAQNFVDLGRLVQEVFQGDISGALKVAKRLLLRSITAPFKNILKTIDSVLGTNLLGWANKTFAPMGRLVDSVFGSLDKSLNGLKNRWGKSFGKMGDAVGDIFRAFKKGGLGGALDAVFGKSGRKLLAGFGDGLAAIPKAIGGFIGGIKTGIGPVDAVLSGVGSTISDLGRLVQEVFQLDFKGAGEVAERIFLRIGNAVYDLLDWFGDLIGVDLLGWAEKAAGPILKIWDILKGIASNALDSLKSAVSGLLGRWGKAFGKMGKSIDEIKNAFKKDGIQGALKAVFGKAGRRLIEGFGDAISAVPKAIGEFFRGFKTGFAPLDNMLGKFADVFTDVGRLIQEVFQGDFKGALEVGKRLLGNFWELIKTTFSSMGETLKAAFGLIGDAIGAIPWSDLWDGAKALGGNLLSAIGDLGQQIYDWVAEKIGLVDWALLWELAKERMSEELAKLADMAAEIGAKILGWLQDAVALVIALAGVVWQALAPIITDLAAKVGGWIVGLPWAEIGAKILEWLQKAVGLVVALAVVVFNALAPIATDLFNKVVGFFANLDYASIGAKIIGWLQKAVGVVTALAIVVWQSLAPIATDLLNKVVGFFTNLDYTSLGATILGWLQKAVGWFIDTYIAVYSLLGNLALDLLGYVVGLFTGLNFVGLGVTMLSWFYSAVKWFVETYIAVYSLLGNLALDLVQYVLGLFTDLDIEELAGKISGWFTGAINSFMNGVGATLEVLADVGGMVVEKLGDLGEKLLGWVQEGLNQVFPWGDIAAGVTNVVDGAGGIIEKLGSFAAGAATWVSDGIAAITGPLANIVTDIIAAIPGADEFAKIVDKLEPLHSAITTVAGWAGDLLGSLKDIGENGFNWIAKQVGGGNGGEGSSDGGDDGASQAAAGAAGLATSLEDSQAAIQTAVSGIMQSLSDLARKMGAVDVTVTKSIANIMTAIGQLTGFLNITGSIGGTKFKDDLTLALGDAEKNTETSATNIKGKLSPLETELGTFGTNAGTNFQTNLNTGLDLAESDTETAKTNIGTSMGWIVTDSGTYGTNAGEGFRANLNTKLGEAVTDVTNRKANIQILMGDLVAQSGAFGTVAGARFRDGLNDGLSDAVTNTGSSIDEIKGKLESIGSQYDNGKSIGSSLGQGIHDGISSWVGAIADAAARAVRGAKDAANKEAQINSPSKVFMRIGEGLGEGAVLGIEHMLRPMANASARLMNAAATGYSGTLGAYGGYAPRGAATNVTNITVEQRLASDELIRLIRDSKEGAEFARNLPRQLSSTY